MRIHCKNMEADTAQTENQLNAKNDPEVMVRMEKAAIQTHQ